MNTGAELITGERRRQIDEKGWDAEHDDEHTEGELALAAICYATPRAIFVKDDRATAIIFDDPWPWEDKWDKRYRYETGNTLPAPETYTQAERISFLVMAGAMIAAEIDHLQRQK